MKIHISINRMKEIKMKIELICCTEVLLEEIASNEFKRKDIAQTYRFAICSSWKTDWKKVNRAIVDRWSVSGLKYIKHLAWGNCDPLMIDIIRNKPFQTHNG